MTTTQTEPARPVKLGLAPDDGQLLGSDGRYEKTLEDLDGLYRDEQAHQAACADRAGAPVYWVESSQREDGPGGLITGVSVLEPGRIGDEYYMTRGHLHVKADRAELYVGLIGHGVMLLDDLNGHSEAIEVRPGEAVYVPGYWVHRSVNVGTERFATLFCYAADAGQDYDIIARAGGMKQLVVERGGSWATIPNPDHTGYQP
jgi:glucose-6-phosphate isomerase, archaeal